MAVLLFYHKGIVIGRTDPKCAFAVCLFDAVSYLKRFGREISKTNVNEVICFTK